MESKDLNKLDFNALVGSLFNYETILKTREGWPKARERNVALKASATSKDDSDEDDNESKDEDEQLDLYAKNIRKFKTMMQRRKREMKKGSRDKFHKT